MVRLMKVIYAGVALLPICKADFGNRPETFSSESRGFGIRNITEETGLRGSSISLFDTQKQDMMMEQNHRILTPANDLCTNAIALTTTFQLGTNVGASVGINACGHYSNSGAVWYKFTGGGGTSQISTCNIGGITPMDTEVLVFSGTCGSLTCIDGDRDYCGQQSRVTISTVNGAVYYVMVRGDGNSDYGQFYIKETKFTLPNNDCSSAIALTTSFQVGTNIGASRESNACGHYSNSGGVWYSLVGNGGTSVISTCSTSGITPFDTEVLVYSGSCGTLTCIEGNRDYCGAQSRATIATLSGITYYVMVRGDNTDDEGQFNIKETQYNLPNNDCYNAIHLTSSFQLGTTIGATRESNACGQYSNSGGVWYKFTGGGGTSQISTCHTSGIIPMDTEILVYSGSCGSLTCMEANRDFCGQQSRATVSTVSGVVYYVMVRGDNTDDEGSFYIKETQYTLANNECANAISLTSTFQLGTTIGATREDNACGYYSDAGGVWYKFTGGGGTSQISTCHTSGIIPIDTEILVFSGTCGLLSCIDADRDYCGQQSRVTVSTISGAVYYVLVRGDNTDDEGSFYVKETQYSLPNNDCIDAIQLTSSPQLGTTIGATREANACGYYSNAGGVWYKLTTGGGASTISTCHTTGIVPFDTEILVFTGTCGSGTLSCIDKDRDSCGQQSSVTISTISGVTYYILVRGDNTDDEGDFYISGSGASDPPPSGDPPSGDPPSGDPPSGDPPSDDPPPPPCFSSIVTAIVLERGPVMMKDLLIGDKVLTGNGEYKTLFTIDHFHPSKPTTFIQIYTEGSSIEERLEMTAGHLVFIEGKSYPVPASTLQVGSKIQTILGPKKVTEIKTITRHGFYNAITTDGTIVCNGIISSTYTSHYDIGQSHIEIAGVKILPFHTIIDMAIAPYSAFCLIGGDSSLQYLCNGHSELSGVSVFMRQLYLFWSHQKDMIKLLILIIYVSFLGLIGLVIRFMNIVLLAIFVSLLMRATKISSSCWAMV